jgi:DHA1 family tetracycline resistance protein-like MFS transporter
LNKALLPIFLVIVVDILGMAIMFPLLPFYTEHLGGTPAQIGLLISTFAVCQLIGGPLLGRMSDTMGRKPLLLLSQLGTLIGFAILAWAGSLWMVFLSRIIDGFTAGNISLAQAYITDVTRPEERTKSFAVIGIAFGVGFLIGPAISGFLVQYGYQVPVFAAMGLSALSILATTFLLPGRKPDLHPDHAARRFTVFDWSTYVEYFRRPALGPLLWQFLAFIFAFSTFMSGFALYAERRFTWQGHAFGPREVGYVYAYVGILGIILQGGLMGRAVSIFGDKGLVKWGFALATLGFILLGWTWGIPMLLGVAALTSISTGVLRPALTSLITQEAAAHEQGGVLGLTQSLQAVASIVAPAAAGFLIEHGKLEAWALMAAASTLLGLLLPVHGKGRRADVSRS